MDFSRPLQVVTPTLDGDVLAALARAEMQVTGRELHRLIGHGSENGVRRAAERLVEQGVVLSEQAGKAKLYRLNRDHIAAEPLVALASLRELLLERLRAEVADWTGKPRVVVLFGSVARGQGGRKSDLDLLVIRPADMDPDNDIWQEQVAELERKATLYTGNDARILEFGEQELAEGSPEPVLVRAYRDGVELYGSLRSLKRLIQNAEMA
jgi:predicted nucleotidyltransferase